MKYVCDVCGWIYDEAAGAEELGIVPGTKFGDLPEDFLCPLCMVGTEFFSEVKEQIKNSKEKHVLEKQKNQNYTEMYTGSSQLGIQS